MLLAKANIWEGEAIDKEEKLSKAISKLNENSWHVAKLEESQRKAEVVIKACNCKLAEVEEKQRLSLM